MQLIRRIEELSKSDAYPFHMPGHKRVLAGDELLAGVFSLDITEIEGFDDLHNARSVIKEAEMRAAECFGADETHFLVNGSTGGILAAINAAVTSGDAIVAAANCHRSVFNAIMLSGAQPYIITPEKESFFGICSGIDAASVDKALSDACGKRRAVVITSPTYEGVTSDIASILKVCRDHNATLIVDAAHGAHFGFSDGFPESAVHSGADVVITSVHKTLPSMTQTALIHINRNCAIKERIRKMLSVFMTSSPSYVFMSSIDSMTKLLTDRKTELFAAYEARLDRFYETAEKCRNLVFMSADRLTAKGSASFDRGKIVFGGKAGSVTGVKLASVLRQKYGLWSEAANDRYVILMTGIADTDEGFERLASAVSELDKMLDDPEKELLINFGPMPETGESGVDESEPDEPGADNIRSDDPEEKNRNFYKSSMNMHAYFCDTEEVDLKKACGRISADLVTVYPPGIPVAYPGEVITKEAAGIIETAMKCGQEITGLKNGKISVLWEKSST